MKKLILAGTLILTSCTSKNDVYSALQGEGYTQIEPGGYDPFVCGHDDTFATHFTALNPKGEKVEGTVCSGLLKGTTIRNVHLVK